MTHRNTSNDIETGVASLFRERHGRYLLTGQAVSGAQVAWLSFGLSYRTWEPGWHC